MKNSDKPINPTDLTQGLTGLTKREHLAAMAMQGLLANPKYAGSLNAQTAECAVSLADELLNQLEKI